MKMSSPRPVLDFTDNGKFWRVQRPANSEANFPKDLVARIEPTKDLKERRTWIDSTGKFSTVARFVSKDDKSVLLRQLDGKESRLQFSQLSSVDREFLNKL